MFWAALPSSAIAQVTVAAVKQSDTVICYILDSPGQERNNDDNHDEVTCWCGVCCVWGSPGLERYRGPAP
jgi:hypothetical protein